MTVRSIVAALIAVGLLAPLVARGAESDTYKATGSPAASQPELPATLAVALTAPTISGPTTPTNQRSATFTFSHSDPTVTSFSCQLDGGEFATCTSPQTYTGIPDGEHTFAARATDATGTIGEAASYPWTVDTVAPDTAVSRNTPPVTNSTSATFSFSSTEGGSSFSCSLDGVAFATCPSPPTYAGLAEGAHTFRVQATDAANNTDLTPASSLWTVDTTPPSPPSIASGPPPLTNQTSASFTFSHSEAVTFSCRLDAGGFATCRTYTVSHGPHTFAVRATDAAGNIGAPTTYSWNVDTAAPNTEITSGPARVTSNTSATFSFSSTEAGSSFSCSLDGAAFATCPSPPTYAGLAEGAHTFRVQATDAANNTDLTPASFSWRVDTTAAAAPIITSNPPPLTKQTSARFEFTSEPDVTLTCKLEDRDFAPCTTTTTATYTGVSDGAHTFTVRATDAGGSGDADYSWTVDTVAPDTAVSSGPPPASTSASATFSFASTEAGSSFSCSLDGAAFATCVSPRIYDGLSNGTHTFRVQATDAATNTDPLPASFTWTVNAREPKRLDRTPPGNVRNVAKSVRYRLLKLRWKKPSDEDFHHVVVLVGKNPKKPPTTRVYRGAGTSYTNSKFRNGRYYRYAITSYDRAGNASRKVGVVVPADVLLTSPRAGARLRTPPLLDWASVPKATYYNVQVYLGSKKVFTAWPGRSSLRLKRWWTHEGGLNRLKAGKYRWFVWPGFGRRSKVDYGELLGQASFVISN